MAVAMTSVISLMTQLVLLVQREVAYVMNLFDIGYSTFAVAERTSLDTGRTQRAVRHLGRQEVTTVLYHMLGSKSTNMAGRADRGVRRYDRVVRRWQ